MWIINALQTTLGVVLSLFAVGGLLWNFWLKKWYTAYKIGQEKWKTEMRNELAGQNVVQEEIRLKVNSLQTGQRNMLDLLDIASWESNSSGNFEYVSAALCELAGCQPKDVMGRSWVGKIAYFDRHKIVNSYKEAIENGSEFTVGFSIRMDDGMYQKVKPVVIHNKDKDGKVLNSMGRLIKDGKPYKYQ